MGISPHLKRLCKAGLYRLGYEIRPVVNCIDSVAARTVKEREYYARWSSPCPVFSPWVGHPEFEKLYTEVGPHTVVSRDRCYILASLAAYVIHLNGDFAECGVYKGGTALLLSRILTDSEKMLYLFDSFKGLPPANRNYDNYYEQGHFSDTSADDVRALLGDFQAFIEIREGWIPETFVGLEDNLFALVHVDVDLYQSALDCCVYFYPRLVSGGIFIFDEYGFPAARGEKDAVDRFFADKPQSPIALPTGQGMVLKI